MTVPVNSAEQSSTPSIMASHYNLQHHLHHHLEQQLGQGHGQPKKLLQVPRWNTAEVSVWVKKVGFSNFCSEFQSSGVDGDLLLQLNEDNLKNDLKMSNGIIRKRFWRELNKLKMSTDYSSCDPHGVAKFLAQHPSLGPDFLVYAYSMIQCDFNLNFVRRLGQTNVADVLKDCGVDRFMHRAQLLEAIFDDIEPDESSSEVGHDYDVYVCNASPSSHGSRELSSLISVHLQRRGCSVYLADNPVSSADDIIRRCRHFVLVLTPGCMDDIRQMNKSPQWCDVVTALRCSSCNIVPVTDPAFQFPDPDQLPANLKAICYFNSVRWIHDYQEACIDKLERFIRADRSDMGSWGRLAISSHAGLRSQSDSGLSTPLHINCYSPKSVFDRSFINARIATESIEGSVASP